MQITIEHLNRTRHELKDRNTFDHSHRVEKWDPIQNHWVLLEEQSSPTIQAQIELVIITH
jgi:hypothetical protein